MVYWSRSRQEVWRKGDTQRRPPVRARGVLRLRRRRAAVHGRAGGQRAPATPATHSLLLPPLRRLTAIVLRIRPDPRRVPRAGRRAHGRAGLDRAAGRPGDAGRGLRQARRRRRRASCSSRSSTASAGAGSRFVGRDPSATLVLRDGQRRRSTATLPAGVPHRPGHARRARGAARAPTGRRCIADLPPLQGGVMGYLGYDVVREVERLPDVPHDDRACPTR